MKKLLFPLCAILLLAGCVKPLPEEKWAAPGPEMRPEKFFAGVAHGNGVIQTPDGRPARRIMVESRGATLADGRFRLDQTITDDRGKISTRFWIMTQTGPSTYTSSLSDAAGAVKGDVRLTVLPGVDHGGTQNGAFTTPGLWEWLAAQRRRQSP